MSSIQDTLFADLPSQAPPVPRRIAEMHRVYGVGPLVTKCRTCRYLQRYRKAGRVSWMKCLRARVTASSATDWRAGWPACGLYVEVD